MTVQGRTSERWGRDRSSRWDPGDTNRWRSYPPVAEAEPPMPDETLRVELPGRPGATERRMVVEWLGGSLMVALHGWYSDVVCLNPRQAHVLRDTLNEWLSDETTD